MMEPKSYFVYEFSYPPDMPELAGIVFYVGKGNNVRRMNHHLSEASKECDCDKCQAIRSIWDAGLVIVRRIVFESTSEQEALQEETARIARHRSPHLTNVLGRYDSPKVASPNTEKREAQASPLERGGWICTTDAFRSHQGTKIIDLARTYGLTKRIRGLTAYYRKSELPGFFAWARQQCPEMFTH